MSYEFYQTLHVLGLFLLFSSLGAAALHAMNGGTKESNPSRKWVAITHGVGLLFVLVAGFGLLAKSGRGNPENWPAYGLCEAGNGIHLGSLFLLGPFGEPSAASRAREAALRFSSSLISESS